MNETLSNDLEKFLGKIVAEIAYRPTKDEAVRLLVELRKVQSAEDVLRAQIKELEAWKESAIAHMPDFQEIGKLLNIPLGESVHDKIIPGIKKIQELQKEVDAQVMLTPFGWWDTFNEYLYRTEHDAKLAEKGGNEVIPLWRLS
jgi:hypothetical protein